jgi:hypothetical protein
MWNTERCLTVLCSLLFGAHTVAHEVVNEHGRFSQGTLFDGAYWVALTLHDSNTEFPRIARVSAGDYDNDGESDLVEIQYRSGSRVVYLRTEDAYHYFTQTFIGSDVCHGDWSPRLSFKVTPGTWTCPGGHGVSRLIMTVSANLLFWPQMDAGLQEARKQDWNALTERILHNVHTYLY